MIKGDVAALIKFNFDSWKLDGVAVATPSIVLCFDVC